MKAETLSSSPPPEKSVAGQPPAQACTVRILRSAQELNEVRAVWNAWQTNPNANMDLFCLLMETRAEIKQTNVLAVSRGGIVESLLLARIEEARIPVRLGYLTLWRPRVRTLFVLHEGFFGTLTEDGALAALKELMSELARCNADRLYLAQQRESSPLVASARRLPGWFFRDQASVTAPHRSLELPAAPGEFLGRMKSKHRSWIKSKARDFEEKFPKTVRYAMYSRPEELAKALADVEAVAAKTYQRGLGAGFQSDDEHKRRFEMEAKAGRLRICVLYGAEAPQAFWIGFIYGDTFHSAYTGYDPVLRDFEVGNLVLVNLIDSLAGEKVKVFDFGLGDAFYKQRFANQCWNDISISIFRPTLRGAFLKLAFGGTYLLARFLRSVLQKLKLVDKAKRLWRARMARAQKEPAHDK